MKLILLKKGVHESAEEKGGYYGRVHPICSSVTLLKAENDKESNILIDTGYTGFEDEILGELAKNDLRPEQIDYILNTHEHFDHCANNYLFHNAVKIVDVLRWERDGKLNIYDSNEKIRLDDRIEIISTPGHKDPHVSIVVRLDKTYVIAGDTLSPNKPGNLFMIEQYEDEQKISSALKVLEIADVIIPGHGEILEKDSIDAMRRTILKINAGGK